MTRSHNYSSAAFVVVGFSILSTGCTSTSQHQRFVMSFLPPAPKTAVQIETPTDPPQIRTNVYLADTPTFIYPNVQPPAKPTDADLRIQRANERFENGKRLYQAGDLEGSRKEFDRAVDVLMGTPGSLKDRTRIEHRLEELVASIHRYDVNGLGAGDLSDKLGYDKAPLEDILEMTFPVDPAIKPKVTEQAHTTVSQLPLEVNDAVVSYIHFFSGDRGRRTLLAGLRRAGRYKPLVQRILAEEGVPQELIYLAQAESGFLPRAVSHKAATGMWQFMQARGREYGLVQSGYSDDRLDPEKATRSAARHLKDLHDHFGDWYLAIAAYNCGPGGVERAVERTGYADFWQLRSRNALPRETTNYVPIILAMTIMAKNPADYGLEGIEVDPPLEYEDVDLVAPTHLALVADVAERPVSELRELNPALLANVGPAGYRLHVPKGAGQVVLAGLQAVPENRRASWRVHRVSQGDTMASIAKQYNTPVSLLSAANSNSAVEAGGLMLIPASLQQPKTRVRATATKYSRTAVRKPAAKLASRTSTKNTAARTSKPVHRRASAGLVQTAALR
jgi:membrane-bound lytic murein transglycosylase D